MDRIRQRKESVEHSKTDTETLAELRTFLDNHREDILNDRARRMAIRLAGPAETDSALCAAISEENFAELYEPELPTIAIDLTNGLREGALLAIEAQNRGMFNVVFIRSEIDCARLVSDGEAGALKITHGILLDAEGNVYSGAFPGEAYASMVETSNMHFLKQCARFGVATFNTPEQVEQSRQKRDVHLIAERAGLGVATRIGSPEDMGHSDVFVKPANSGGGKGVRMFNASWQHGQAAQFHAFLDRHGYEPIIEERVRCYPVYDPDNPSRRLDWNVRFVVAGGQPVSIYAWAGEGGRPLNAVQGSQRFSIAELGAYVRDEQELRKLNAVIAETGRRLAEASDSMFLHHDVIIDENASPVLLETNIGQVSGITQGTLLGEPGVAGQVPAAIVSAWAAKMQQAPVGPPRGRTVKEERTACDVIGLFKGLYNSPGDVVGMLSRITPEELRRLEPSHFDVYLWYWSHYLRKDPGQDDEGGKELEERFIYDAPLEFATYMPQIAAVHPRPAELIEWIEVLEYILGDDPALKEAREQVRSAVRRRGHEATGSGQPLARSVLRWMRDEPAPKTG